MPAAMPVAIRQLSTAQPDFETTFEQVLHWSAATDDAIEQRVAAILADVRSRGDAALLEYTARFDGLQVFAGAAVADQAAPLPAAAPGAPARGPR